MNRDIALWRLSRQQIPGQFLENPQDVVRTLCALQAQDYAGALWSIGLRARNATLHAVSRAVDRREIVRTWLLRGTLHFAAPEDIRWILSLVSGRIIAGAAGRHRQLGLTRQDYDRCRKLLVAELDGGRQLTRSEIFRILEKNGVSPEGQRGYHLLWKAGLEGLICYGPHRGGQPAFVLLDDWVPGDGERTREEALAELAVRYFAGHGPATLKDFVWWSGLGVSDARTGIAGAGPALEPVKHGDTCYFIVGPEPSGPASGAPAAFLLPGFDEFIVGYRDRSAMISPEAAGLRATGSNGMMHPVVVIDGMVVGTWKREIGKKGVTITIKSFQMMDPSQKRRIAEAAERYGGFLGLPSVVA